MKPGEPLPAVLVIGYGNPLRGDDAVGPALAGRVAAQGWPGVAVLTPHQLTPELAEPIAAARTVVFADAAPELRHAELRSLEPSPGEGAPDWGHAVKPAALLAFSRSLCGGQARAWFLALPAEGFEHGASLSPLARQGVEEGCILLYGLLARLGHVQSPGISDGSTSG